MSEIIDQLYAPLLAEHGFIRDSDNQQYGALGICWKLSPEVGEGTYWTYGQKDLYDIKIHNFSFHKDFMLECSLPECLSITQYDSISGEELVLIFMIAMFQTLSTFAASGGGSKFEIVDSEYGIYRLNSSRERLATNADNSLIEDNGSYYICLQDGLYAKAQKIVFSKNSSLATLRPETRRVVKSIFEECEESGTELLNNAVEVYIPINENMLSQSSLMATSTFPVTNEQVRYTSVGNEQVIKSGTNAFQSYATTVINNIAKTVVGGAVSKINPYAGAISTIANLFPSKYNEVRSYTNWTFGVKLQEEKVVQLSWVYVANSPYLGAQTQFATIRYMSILTKGLQTSITDTSSYLYYRTPHYQSPETIARQHYTDTWVEQIQSYPIDGVDVKSLA